MGPQNIVPQQQQPGGLGQPGMAGLLGLAGGLLGGQGMGQSMMGRLPGLLSQLAPDQRAKVMQALQMQQQAPAGGGGMMGAQGWQPMPQRGPQGIY